MEFNALSQLNGNNPFSTQSTVQQQNQQQQHFYSPQSRNVANSQMMFSQPGSYPPNTPTQQTQNTNLLTASNLPNQQYSAWGAGNVLNMATARRARPRPLNGTPPGGSFNMPPPRGQAANLQAHQHQDPMHWGQKSPTGMDVSGFDSDMTDLSQNLGAVDEENGIIDLRQIGRLDPESSRNSFQADMESRRPSQVSDSTYATTRLTTPEMAYPSDSDWSSAERNSGQFSSFSPMESPCHPMRPGSRSRASPNPHNNMRTSPYTLESNRRLRWSTGMNVPSQQPAPRAPYQYNRYSSFYGPSPLNPHNGLTSVSNDQGVTTFAGPGQSLSYSSRMLAGTPAIMFNGAFPDPPRQLPSQSLFPLLPSDRIHAFGGHFADLSDPPDLFASLHDPPSDPPEEDMNSSDPDLVPHEQELRFPGDLYTPRWVRGHGNKREGWCGLCKPGRWLVLKNSAYWYDKSFTHGVCAQTGAAFAAPEATRRVEGNADAWEGLCGHCGEWLSLVSSKKKGPTTWFRHVSKCHVMHKPKDVPKRRRGTAKRHTLPDAIITDITDVPQASIEDTAESEVKDEATTAAAEPEPEPDHSMFNNDFACTTTASGLRSAAVSPRTTPADRLVEQVIDQTMSESSDSRPLTAVRVGMEIDELPEPLSRDAPGLKYEASPEDYTSAHADSKEDNQRTPSMAQQGRITISCADLFMPKPTALDSKSELQLQTQDLNFKAPPSPAITPVSTPQLSATSLSTTPQIDTPHQSMPLLGLGMSGIPGQTSQDFAFTFNLEDYCGNSLSHDMNSDGFSSDSSHQYSQHFHPTSSSESSPPSNSQPTSAHQLASSYSSAQPTYSAHDLSAHLYTSAADLRPINDMSEDILGLPLDMRIRFEADARKYANMESSSMSSVGASGMPAMGNLGMLEHFGGMI